MRLPLSILLSILALGLVAFAACGDDDDGGSVTLTVYSGRAESLIGPLLSQFTDATGIEVAVRYGSSAEMAALILEEGSRTPADIYFSQDAGDLGVLESAGLVSPLKSEWLQAVDSRFVSPTGGWIGVSARARVIVYNTDEFNEETVPASYKDLTDPRYRGMVGWAPTNASFHAFVTAIRQLEGEDAARQWLEDMKANRAVEFSGNTQIVEAVGRGEVTLGLVNHYYLFRFLAEQGEGFKARNAFSDAGDAGSLVNIAGVAIIKDNNAMSAAERFVEFLLSREAQEYFRDQTSEYPLAAGVQPRPELPPLDSLNTPELPLGDLADVQATLDLLRSTGVLP